MSPEIHNLKDGKDHTKESSKDALFRAAKRVFAAKGYEGSTVKELADEAGVNISLVSYHFNGKENLFRACVQAYGEERLLATERYLKPAESLEELRLRLGFYLEDYFQSAIRDPDTMLLMHRECTRQNPVIEDLIEGLFIKAANNLVAFMQDAADKGLLHKGFDAHYLTMCLLGTIIHAIQIDWKHEQIFKTGLKDQAHREKLVQTLLQMVLGPKTRD